MCGDCMVRHGNPTHADLPEGWQAIVEDILAIYEWSPVGMPLHIELDDFNVEHDWWEPYAPSYAEAPQEIKDATDRICAYMKALPEGEKGDRQRAAVVGRGHGYL